MNRDLIPFFSELPEKAVKPASKLWDAAKEPSYNGLTAYHDFVAALEGLKIAPPPRTIVKRWVAGVQAGLIGRPEAQAEVSQAVQLTYFDNLPTAAQAALQAAWDKADGRAFPARKIFESFCRDMNDLSLAGPEWREFDAWVKAVVSGHVDRPAKQVERPEVAAEQGTPSPALKGRAERKSEGSVSGRLVAKREAIFNKAAPGEPEDFVPLTVSNFVAPTLAPAQLPDPRPLLLVTPLDAIGSLLTDPLRSMRDQMVEDTVKRLQADIRQNAEKIVAAELRRIAAEISGEAA